LIEKQKFYCLTTKEEKLILSDHPCKNGNAYFTMLKPLSDQYRNAQVTLIENNQI